MRQRTERTGRHPAAATGTRRTGARGCRGLSRFNSATPQDAEAALKRCCGSARWAQLVAGHRPYPDLEALLAAADEASYDLTAEDLGEALAAEAAAHISPPLGSADAAVPEQPGTLAAHTALQAAHAAYESRFGHAFVICLDGYAREELLDQVLAGIRARLANDPLQERESAAEELRRLARSRLSGMVERAAD